MREVATCEILGLIDEESLVKLLDLLPEDLELVGPVREGLVLMGRREGLGSPFYLGEVLASNCRVRWQGVEGWAMTMGPDTRRALVAAAVDALNRIRPEPKMLGAVRDLIRVGRDAILRNRIEEARLTASTRVEFDLLPGA